MTLNHRTLELRNLIAETRPDGLKSCGVCGKPNARIDQHVKLLPYHAKALREDYAGKFRNLTKVLGGAEKIMDFVSRQNYNAQLEFYRESLTKAREEHDAYVPPEKVSDKELLRRTLKQTLDMLGVKLTPNPADPKGEWSTLALGDAVQYNLGKLLSPPEVDAGDQHNDPTKYPPPDEVAP